MSACSYRPDLEPALRGLTFKVLPKEKVSGLLAERRCVHMVGLQLIPH